MSGRVEDIYTDEAKFEELLEQAEDQASSHAEEDFVRDIRTKFKQYGKRMFLSVRQHDWLLKIAGEDNRDGGLAPVDRGWR